jgi:hypothetical protein
MMDELKALVFSELEKRSMELLNASLKDLQNVALLIVGWLMIAWSLGVIICHSNFVMMPTCEIILSLLLNGLVPVYIGVMFIVFAFLDRGKTWQGMSLGMSKKDD